jgi:hypothetical protein
MAGGARIGASPPIPTNSKKGVSQASLPPFEGLKGLKRGLKGEERKVLIALDILGFVWVYSLT